MTSTTAPPEGPAPTGPVRDCRATFFRSVRGLGVVRGEDRWFAGVCGAVAARTGYDPLLVRGTVAALTAVGGLGLACYGLAWLLLPDARKAGRIEAEAVTRGDVSGAAWLAGALVVLDLFVPRALVGILTTGRAGPGWGFLITTLVALLGWWVLRDQRFTQFAPPRPRLSLVKTPRVKTPPSSAPVVPPDPAAEPAREPAREPIREPVAGFGSATERSAARAEERRIAQQRAQERAAAAKARRRPGSPLLTTAVLGLALLAAGAVVVLGLLVDLPGRTVPLACCAAVAVMGFGAVLAGVRGRRTALVGLAWPAAFCAVATSLLPPATGWTWQVQKTWSPTGATALSSAVGQLSVDPSRLDGGPARATIAAGRLDVLVPDDATVLVEVRVLVGSVRWQDDADVVALDGTATQHSVDGADLRQVFAVGPDAAALADTLVVRGDDPAGWTVPAGTPELQAVAWTGEVRLAAAGSTLLEDR